MTLEWDHDGVNTDGYNVYRHTGAGPHVVAMSTDTTVDVMLPGKYFVTAYNTEAESAASNTVWVAQYYYNSIRYDYDQDGRVIYKGEHTDYNAATSDTNWTITRYTYTAGGQVESIAIRTTSWDDRASGW